MASSSTPSKNPNSSAVTQSSPTSTMPICSSASLRIPVSSFGPPSSMPMSSMASMVALAILTVWLWPFGWRPDVVRSLRKQLSIAKDARRVDVLCHRVSLSDQILKGTERFRDIQTVVLEAAKKLKKEVGPLDKVSAIMARGIVNRLSCGAEVQRLCAIAIGVIDFMLPGLPIPLADANVKIPRPPNCRIKFDDVSPVSVIISLTTERKLFEDAVIGYRLWHRKSCLADYSEEPTCILLWPNTRIMISGLSPSTEYCFKASPFSSLGELGIWEATLITKAANFDPMLELEGFNEEEVRGEQLATTQTNSQKGSTSSSDSPQETRRHRVNFNSHSRVLPLEYIADNGMKHSPPTSDAPFARSNSVPLETPTKSDAPNNNPPDSGNKSESAENQYKYCVKVIRWLECEGFMEKEFRVKFLTWFSLRATMQERRVVSAFIDVLIDEPASLVDQLVDTFMDGICGKEKVDDVCNVKPVGSRSISLLKNVHGDSRADSDSLENLPLWLLPLPEEGL
ncbi:hypothetical protein Taro_028562 [Colocasia esculenta]|uniref:Fibronectin type-III domain-containing protein n=1 Tax=Colocasia esculenta TaxID=4460 RepID=A0A843VIY3_COLES|nr:hypothetical protein [Colocasia esculenta]